MKKRHWAYVIMVTVLPIAGGVFGYLSPGYEAFQAFVVTLFLVGALGLIFLITMEVADE